MVCGGFWRKLGRIKRMADVNSLPGELDKCLGLVDLTAIGVGSTMGVGIYVLVGEVAKLTAGPAVVFSFLLAAFVSLLSGVCYAEFGARMHITGSAYTYAYVAVGELVAFVIGWSMLAECIIGAASVGSAWSGYFDSITNHSISGFITENVGRFHSPFLGEYPDFLAFAIAAAMTAVLITGAKFNSITMLIFTVLNFAVVATCIVAGLFYVDIRNWTENGGFFPYGFNGIINGAATCFYAFVGFDAIAVSSEEAKNPSRDIPLAIIATLLICFFAYAFTSLILTLVVPYHALSATAPLSEAFAIHGATIITYLVAIGSIVALTASMLGSFYPVPRLAFAMSRDGLVFQFLSILTPRTKVPLFGCLFAGLITGLLSLVLSMSQLVEMMSIGTLVAYMLVAASVVLLRHKPCGIAASSGSYRADSPSYQGRDSYHDLDSAEGSLKVDEEIISREDGISPAVKRSSPNDTEMGVIGGAETEEKEALVGPEGPTSASYKKVQICTFIYGVASCLLSEAATIGRNVIVPPWFSAITAVVCLVTLVVTALLIASQPQDETDIPFRVPFTPYLPLFSMTCDFYLMSHLTYKTWIRFALWLFCGLTIYFGYGIRHSRADAWRQETIEDQNDSQREPILEKKK